MTDSELSILEKRVSKGFDILLERELCGDTGKDFQGWFTAWEKLLRSYEGELDSRGATRA